MMPVAASLWKLYSLFQTTAVLVAGAVVRQNIFADVLQKLAEDVVEHQEVDALRRVLLIDRRDVIAD